MPEEPCFGCGDSGMSYSPPPIQPCQNTPGNCVPVDASCVTYTGPKLNCSDINPNTDVETILQTMDQKICSIEGGDWSTYNYHCLADDFTITSASEFVSAMTDAYCNLQSNYDTFTGTTYPTQITALNTSINSILSPGLTLCAASGITSSDTYTSILTKFSNKICDLSVNDVSTANWSQCFTVPTPPSTVLDGFNVVLDQVCQVKALTGTTTLPTFNNQGSCLPSPGTADSLVNTITKIKTRLCQSPTYDINATTWSCITQPADFQGVVNAVVGNVQSLMSSNPVFDTNIFSLTPNGCNGTNISLQPGFAGVDRLVASDSLDSSPGTLSDKIQAGTNITTDNITVPGKLIINAASSLNDKVKSNVSDASSGYLFDKLLGSGTDGISLATSTLVDNSKVVVTPSLDFSVLATKFFDQVEGDPNLYARFCALICGCKPCQEGGTPVTPSARRVRLRVVNNSPTNTYENKYTLFQNSPVLGWTDTTIVVAPSETYESGWYDVTSSLTTLSSSLSIIDAGHTGVTQNLTIRVLQPGNTAIPGTTSFTGVLGAGYSNSSFSLGSLVTDITVEVRIS